MGLQFFRGLFLAQNKEPALSRDRVVFLKPQKVLFPIDENNEIKFTVGSFIAKNERFSVQNGEIGIHAPFTSYYRGNISLKCFDNKAQEFAELEYSTTQNKPSPLIERNTFPTPEEIIVIAKRAGIVDEYDGKPLFKKLYEMRKNKTALLIANAVDDEPYVSSGINLLLKDTKQVADGLKLAAKAAGTSSYFAVMYGKIGATDEEIPKSIHGLQIKKLECKYPAKIQIKDKFSDGKTTGIIGVAALYHLFNAVINGEPQNTCFVTVAGDCVANPSNIMVPIGTSVKEILLRLGLSKTPSRIILGTSMNGEAISDLNFPVSASTRSILAFKDNIDLEENICIGCGKCIAKCPVKILPTYIHKEFMADNIDNCRYLQAERCIDCGVCSYVCPAEIELSYYVNSAKKQIELK